MYTLLRPIIFRLDPERAHHYTLNLLRLAGSLIPVRGFLYRLYQVDWPAPVEAFGLQFPNPVGLAAGYDKDGLAWRGLAALGFGHVEIGTITRKPQPGNPRPRVFRLPEDRALINRLGFPGQGKAFVLQQLEGARPAGLLLGANLGLNKGTPLERAAEDYVPLLEAFAPLVDYLVVNVSSPNSVGLRRLQARQALADLLARLMAAKADAEGSVGRRTPLLVKLAPDLSDEELSDAVGVVLDSGLDGIVATNTTLRRDGLRSDMAGEAGGLSGTPLQARSTEVVARISALTGGNLPIIAVGGVMDAVSAKEKLEAGAVLVQLYTGLIYRGPGVVKEILTSLME